MKISKMFYDDSKRYYKAAQLLTGSQARDEDDQLLLTPIFFLLRHSTELILKSLIIKFNESSINFEVSKFVPHFEDGTLSKRQLLNIHSLKDLYSFLKYEIKNNNLFDIFNEKESKLIVKVINEVDGIDNKSDYFRYPISTNNRKHKRHFVSMSEDGIAPEINKGYFLFIFGDNDNNKVISFKANEKYIKLVDNLSKIVNIFIEKY